MRVDECAEPVPAAGQVLTKVLACGICGSDLHLLRHGEEARRLTEELDADAPPDPLRPVMFEPDAPMVMGHEFCCEVVDVGPGVDRLKAGDVVVEHAGRRSTPTGSTPSGSPTATPAATPS